MQGIKINDEMTATGQVTEDDINEAATEGFKSILNLRAPDEDGVLSGEHRLAEAAGLQYVNMPFKKDELNDHHTTRVLAEIDSLPKPLLIHCGLGVRAGAVALMNVATRSGTSAKDAMAQAQAAGFDCDSEPELKAYFERYIDAHHKAQ